MDRSAIEEESNPSPMHTGLTAKLEPIVCAAGKALAEGVDVMRD